MAKEIIGIDFGSANTRIYSSLTKGVVFYEPTSIALDSYTGDVKEVGFLSKKIQDRTPYNINVIGPIKNGQVYDIDVATSFLQKVFKDLRLNSLLRGVTLVLACPSESSKVSQQALIEIGKRIQAKEIYIESSAKLSALGAGESIDSPEATLVCNIGHGVTDIACLSLGEIVECTSSYVAGGSFDEAIRRDLNLEQHIQVGLSACEIIKKKIGNLSSNSENKLSEIKGKDTMTSLPTSAIVSSSFVRKSIQPLCDIIAMKVSDVILNLSSELSSDLVTNGLLLTGGSALLPGLKEYISSRLSIPVKVANEPENATINGLGIFIEKLLNK